MLALPALVVWVATAHTTVGWGQALGVAGAGWFLGHGTAVQVDAVSLSVAPLGVTLLALAVTVRAARRLLDATERTAPGTTWPLLLVRRVGPGFVGGYAAFAAPRVAAHPRGSGPPEPRSARSPSSACRSARCCGRCSPATSTARAPDP